MKNKNYKISEGTHFMSIPSLNEVSSEITDDFTGQTNTDIMPGHSGYLISVFGCCIESGAD